MDNKNQFDPFKEYGLAGKEADISVDLTLAKDKAWVKMSKSALAEPNDWILCLIEAAILQGADLINVRRSYNTTFPGGAASISIVFSSKPFPDDLSRLPFYLIANSNDKEESVLHLVAMGIAGAIGNGAKLLDLSFYNGNNIGQRIVIDALDNIKVSVQRLGKITQSSWTICFTLPSKSRKGNELFEHPAIGDFSYPVASKAVDAFEHLCKKAPLISYRPSIYSSELDIMPKNPHPFSDVYKQMLHSYFAQDPIFSISFNDASFHCCVAFSMGDLKPDIYLTRHYLKLATAGNIYLPYKVHARIMVDHPKFKTDLSRSRIDPECDAYRELIKKLPLWQETALYKFFNSVFSDDVYSRCEYGPLNHRIFFYRFVKDNAHKIKERLSKGNEVILKGNDDIIKLFLTTPFLSFITKESAKKLSFWQKIGLLKIPYEKTTLLALSLLVKTNRITVVLESAGSFWSPPISNESVLYFVESPYSDDALYLALKALFGDLVQRA